MASREPQFQMAVAHRLIPNNAPQRPSVQFLLSIRTYLQDDNGRVQEDPWQPERELRVDLPEPLFGSPLHRHIVSQCLLEVGFLDQEHRELLLDIAFSTSVSIIEKEKEKMMMKKNTNGPDDMIRIIFRFEKIVRMEYSDDELEETALELSMQEDPIPIPATIESIQALRKMKLDEGYGDGDDIECMICMEKMVLSESKVVSCMPCSHLFHTDCIERWLSCSHLCPLCRFPMPTDAENH